MKEKKRISFTLAGEAYDMLVALQKKLECPLTDVCEIAIFHLLGSWEHDKLQQAAQLALREGVSPEKQEEKTEEEATQDEMVSDTH